MSMIQTLAGNRGVFAIGEQLKEYSVRMLAAFAAWRRRRRAIIALHDLSDRNLADIGIDRSEIESIVYKCSRDASRRLR